MNSLIWMRLRGYAVTGRALVPLLAALVMLGTIYGGGQAQVGDAYGMSAAVLLPVLAWQTKMLLDVEPDVQRRLASIALGSADREVACGLIASLLATIPLVGLALLVPWLVGGVTGTSHPGGLTLGQSMGLGIWAHLLLAVPAVAVGSWASRAVTRTAGAGAMVLATGAVGALVLGLDGSPAPWLAPPAIATARQAASGGTWPVLLAISLWAVLWTTVVVGGYVLVRRSRR